MKSLLALVLLAALSSVAQEPTPEPEPTAAVPPPPPAVQPTATITPTPDSTLQEIAQINSRLEKTERARSDAEAALSATQKRLRSLEAELRKVRSEPTPPRPSFVGVTKLHTTVERIDILFITNQMGRIHAELRVKGEPSVLASWESSDESKIHHVSFAGILKSGGHYSVAAWAMSGDGTRIPTTDAADPRLQDLAIPEEVNAPQVSLAVTASQEVRDGQVVPLVQVETEATQDVMFRIVLSQRVSDASDEYVARQTEDWLKLDELGAPTNEARFEQKRIMTLRAEWDREYKVTVLAQNRIGRRAELKPKTIRIREAPSRFEIIEPFSVEFGALGMVVSWRSSAAASRAWVDVMEPGVERAIATVERPRSSTAADKEFSVVIPLEEIKKALKAKEPYLCLRMEDGFGRTQSRSFRVSLTLPSREALADAERDRRITREARKSIEQVIDDAGRAPGKGKVLSTIASLAPFLLRAFVPMP